MKLKCVIIDDEPLAVSLLKSYAEQTSFLELVGSFENPLLAIDLLQSGEVDLLFLDINMPQITGVDFAKTLPSDIKVVFTTAYDQYAIEGFKVNALDYLLKPISYPEFLKAANKALEWFRMTRVTTASVATNSNIFVKSGYRVEKIDLNKILYIENQKDYVKFHLEGVSEPVSSLMSMQSLEEKLPPSQFMRVHRSFIVNLNQIKTVERNSIVFGKEYIPVSDSYKEQFLEFLNKHFF